MSVGWNVLPERGLVLRRASRSDPSNLLGALERVKKTACVPRPSFVQVRRLENGKGCSPGAHAGELGTMRVPPQTGFVARTNALMNLASS